MATDPAAESAPDSYERMLETATRVYNLGAAGEVLNWDQEVMMPEEGTPARAGQLSAVAAVRHDELTSDELAADLEELDGADLTDEQRAVVREVRREHERAAEVPGELVEEISQVTSEAHPVWKDAKEDDDYDAFAPTLERLIDLRRQQAEHLDPDGDHYEVLFEGYEPYLGLDKAEEILGTLRDELLPLIDDLNDADADLADPFEGTYAVEDQQALHRETLDLLGYDWDRGRLDEAPHPFSTGTQFDARVTTRYEESDPMGSLTSTIHEFGHAFYTLGLPEEHYGTPLGNHRNLSVHESQSRLWENHVGRSRAFADLIAPTFEEHLGTDLDGRELYEAANQIYPENLIRIEADELTYHMHIVLRFEIERDLFHGDLEVGEIPQVWNDKMEEYLGVRPDTDADGCLQDIHWSQGSFGYFPTYTLGSVMAAQLYAAAEDDLGDLDGHIREGNFEPLANWLRENVHSHGQRYTTDELVREATGEPLTADYFVEYAHEKFGDLYGI